MQCVELSQPQYETRSHATALRETEHFLRWGDGRSGRFSITIGDYAISISEPPFFPESEAGSPSKGSGKQHAHLHTRVCMPTHPDSHARSHTSRTSRQSTALGNSIDSGLQMIIAYSWETSKHRYNEEVMSVRKRGNSVSTRARRKTVEGNLERRKRDGSSFTSCFFVVISGMVRETLSRLFSGGSLRARSAPENKNGVVLGPFFLSFWLLHFFPCSIGMGSGARWIMTFIQALQFPKGYLASSPMGTASVRKESFKWPCDARRERKCVRDLSSWKCAWAPEVE